VATVLVAGVDALDTPTPRRGSIAPTIKVATTAWGCRLARYFKDIRNPFTVFGNDAGIAEALLKQSLPS
jgi:hypothetical protein